LDRFCVVYPYQPSADFPFQIAARVMAFDGTNVSSLTHSFYPFVNAISDAAGASASGLTFSGGDPTVAMPAAPICIAAKGTFNRPNKPTAGADTQPQQTVYVVVSHPAAVAPPEPEMTITQVASNVTINWQQDAGLFVLQTASSLASP